MTARQASAWSRKSAPPAAKRSPTPTAADNGAGTRIVTQALDTFGRIDCVVNNAGILRDRFFHKMSDEEWDAVLKVHLYGTFNLSRAAAPHFKDQESGAFVHMTSTSGLIGNFAQANYNAAKMGIAGLSKSIALDLGKFNVGTRGKDAYTATKGGISSITRSMAVEYAPYRIRVNAVAPAVTKTARVLGLIDKQPEVVNKTGERQLLGLIEPNEVALTAMYLASDESKTTTGQIFPIDGGFSIS